MKKSKTEISECLGQIGLFICSSGFEKRSVSLVSALNSSQLNNAIIFDLDENYAISREHINLIRKNIPHICKVEYPKNNPLETFDIFYSTLLEYSKKKATNLKIVVDITTFTREILLILLKILALEEFINVFAVRLVYTPADSYSGSWLTKGVREIRSVFGYSGMNYPSKKLLLIVLNGFETERTEEIINSFEPNNILLGKPSIIDSANSELDSVSFEKFQFIKSKYESILLQDFEFSLVNIGETKNILNILINQYSDNYNIIVSPLNNKISTLGVAIVGIKNEKVQICYASANQYNINTYSEGCDYFLVYNLNDLLNEL